MALAALRWHGLRSQARYLVFQVLPYTLGLGPEVWRVLDRAHTVRNMGEYDGYWEVDDVLLGDLLRAAQKVEEAVSSLGPILPPEA